jgi:HrpA-like RNA helicase
MKKFPEPDIRVNDISAECLRLLAIPSIKTVEKLLEILTQFIEPPREEYIMSAVTLLIKLGAIENGEITQLGLVMAEIGGNDLPTAYCLLMGRVYNCSNELAAIFGCTEASRNNMGGIFVSPRTIIGGKYSDDPARRKVLLEGMTKKFDSARGKFKHKYGDHLSLLKLMDKFREVFEKYKEKEPNKINEWCTDHFLKINTLKKARKYAKKIKQYARSISRDSISIKTDEDIMAKDIDDRILHCLMAGFIDNKGYAKDDKFYRTLYVKDENVRVDRMSFLTLSKLPKNVIYTELFVTMGRNTINIVSKVPSS